MTKAYFPMETLRVTQGYGVIYQGVAANTFSHKGSYALDLGGADGGQDWLYAPFDCRVLRVYGSYNAVWFESLEPVDTVGGKVILLCLHINNADKTALGLAAGKTFKQGEKIYREGTAGQATGNHVHLEVGKSPFTGTGWHKNASGVWEINNKLVPSEVFTLPAETVVAATGGYAWVQEEPVVPLSAEPVRMCCTATGADAAKVSSVLEGLAIGFQTDGNEIITQGTVSAGDQRTLIANTPEGVVWSIYTETQACPTQQESQELAAAKALLEKATAELESEKAQREALQAIVRKIREAVN